MSKGQPVTLNWHRTRHVVDGFLNLLPGGDGSVDFMFGESGPTGTGGSMRSHRVKVADVKTFVERLGLGSHIAGDFQERADSGKSHFARVKLGQSKIQAYF